MSELCKLFKIELYKIPKSREAEYKQKLTSYYDKIKEYQKEAKRLKLVINNDEVGLLAMD